MIRRPKATDTEEDLLAFQGSFLSSGSKPSASLKVVAGEKRKKHQTFTCHQTEEETRDVVRLENEVVKVDGGRPQTKRSKFREGRESLKKHEPEKNLLESQDKVLTDIKECGGLSSTESILMSGWHTKHGFPLAKQLDLMELSANVSSTAADGKRPSQEKSGLKKKSLFAEFVKKNGIGFLGIDNTPSERTLERAIPQRDYVEPLRFNSEFKDTCDMKPEGTHEGNSIEDMECGSAMKQEYESTAAETWERFKSGLISGEGLVSMGASEDTVKSDISKIDQENMEKLSSLSEEEIMKEKKEIEQILGPELVAFVKSRKSRKLPQDNRMATTAIKEASSIVQTESVVPPKEWLHMDVVEKEKLEWMVDVYPSSPRTDLDRTETRFSLDGRVIPRSADLPSHLGLHHHGDEPQAAGYTLAELLPLSRSAVLQQRILSLQTLSMILRRARQREFEGLITGSVVMVLLKAGLPLLLRYALDESIETVVIAAVQTMHSLLVIPSEEVMLEEYYLCYCGNLLPALKPHRMSEMKGKDEEESDVDVLQRDVIEGYLRMNLLPRVRYILEVLPLIPMNIKVKLLEILSRVSRHSITAATQVLNCPRLIQVVFKQYLPLSWLGENESNSGGADFQCRSLVAAIQLIKALCMASRNIASHLISDYSLLSVLTRYAILHPTELNLPEKEAYHLAVASLTTWQVILSYGFGDEAFRDTFPIFLKQLQHLSSATVLSELETKRISALLGVVESIICLSAVSPDQLKVDDHNKLLSPAVEWSHAAGILTPLIHTLITWVKVNVDAGPGMKDRILIMSNVLNIVATYYDKLRYKVDDDILKAVEQVENIVSLVIKKLPESSLFSMALQAIREGCNLNTSPSPETNLLSLPSHFSPPVPAKSALYGQEIKSSDSHLCIENHVVLMRCTNLVLGFVRLCYSCVQLNKGLLNNISWIFTNPSFQGYLNTALSRNEELSLVSYLDVKVFHFIIKLFIMWIELQKSSSVDEGVFNLFHSISFQLLVSVPLGLEYITQSLLVDVIYHPLFYSKYFLTVRGVLNMTLRDIGTTGLSTAQLISETNLVDIKHVYLRSLGTILASRKYTCIPSKLASLLLPAQDFAVPLDWILSPVVLEYDRTLADNSSAVDKNVIKQSLSFLLLVEHLYPHALSRLSVATKLARVMCVFIIGNDLFLEPQIHSLLYALLKLYCRAEEQSSLDFNSPVPGLFSFPDLYRSFLEQFSAVSYGDHLFGYFVLIPLQQRCPVCLRRMLWEDYPHLLRMLSQPLEQLPMDVKLFLYPIETDEHLIERYMSAIATSVMKKSPLLYLVAIHHLHSFVFKVDKPSLISLQRQLLQGILYIKDEAVKRDLLLYGGYNANSVTGFELCSKMSDGVRASVETVTGSNLPKAIFPY